MTDPSPALHAINDGQEALPDLDRLARLACQCSGVAAALLVEWTLPNPTLLARHGLDASMAAQVLAHCLQTGQPERAHCTTALRPGAGSAGVGDLCFLQSWPLPTDAREAAASLILLDTRPRDCALPDDPRLTQIGALAADLLGFIRHHLHLLQRGEHSAVQNNSALRESQSRLNLTEHTAGVGSWSLDLASRVLVHSDELASILGLRPDQPLLSTEDMVLRCAPEWRSSIRQRLELCERNGLGFDDEIQITSPDGGLKWVRAVGSAVLDGAGQILRIQGAMQDITAQKQAQQETTLLAMRLTTTLASITEAFVTLDRQCCYTYLN